MNTSARLYNCARCHRQVIICRHCDRGNVYCAEGCADSARTESLRRAGKKYQSSGAGRLANALRQQRYRARQQQIVTHQGSVVVAVNDVLPLKPHRLPALRQPASVIDKTILRCHFCHGVCDVFLRLGFLRSPKRHRWRD